jgi:topoisomerase-4 subunit A
VQANYILDTRLRSLRKLEEMQLKGENDELVKEKTGIEALLADQAQQWKTIAWQVRDVRKKFGPESKIGKRRSSFEAMPETADVNLTQVLIEREPVTIVVTEKGWIRSLKGHVADLSTLAYKGDDALKTSFFAETTSKILVFATNGKSFTLEASKLPGGRGQGEPIRLMVDIEEGEDILTVMPYQTGVKMLVAGSDGRGFVVSQDDMVSSTRKGRAVLNLDAPARASVLVEAIGDHIAIIGENRKMLIFTLDQIPEMARGKGVRLQRYKDGGVADAKVFKLSEGLSWKDSAGRSFSVEKRELKEWIGNRAEAGRLPPKGFPRNNKFG